jgi:hypothetical protein
MGFVCLDILMLEHARAEIFQGYRTTDCFRVTSACGLKTVQYHASHVPLWTVCRTISPTNTVTTMKSSDVSECTVAGNRGQWVSSVQDALLENGK